MSNQTIDGVLVSRELLNRLQIALSNSYCPERFLLNELRALLDAPVNPLSEIEVLRAAVKELEALRDARVDAKLAQVKPVAWRYKKSWEKTGWVICENHPEKLGVYDDCYTIQPLYAEQPAPVAHTMKSVMEAICKIDGFPMLTSNQCHALAVKLNACLDEVKRLNP